GSPDEGPGRRVAPPCRADTCAPGSPAVAARKGLARTGNPPYRSSMDVRWAQVAETAEVARLLHDFNTEFDTPSPGVAVLTARLAKLLPEGRTTALLAGDPAVAVALLTSRPNVWYDGPVLL